MFTFFFHPLWAVCFNIAQSEFWTCLLHTSISSRKGKSGLMGQVGKSSRYKPMHAWIEHSVSVRIGAQGSEPACLLTLPIPIAVVKKGQKGFYLKKNRAIIPWTPVFAAVTHL